MKYALRMTEAQHNVLRSHLFPGDGNEAVALLLCGRRKGQERHILSVRKVVKVPHTVCDPRPDRITWPTGFVDSLLEEAYGNECAIVKVHSHGIDYRKFSETDNRSDQGLFASVTSLLNDGLPHASVIMLQDGEVFGRVLGGRYAYAADVPTPRRARGGPKHYQYSQSGLGSLSHPNRP